MVPRFDIDLLYILRSGINVANDAAASGIPCPIAHFTARCQRAEYKVLDQQFTPSNDQEVVQRMQSMLSGGWMPTNSEVHFVVGEKNEVCSICHESLSEGSHPIETSCNHQFHEECWAKHVNHTVERAVAELLPPPPPPPMTMSTFQFDPLPLSAGESM